MDRRTRLGVFGICACIFLPGDVNAQQEIIEACNSMARDALRSFYSYSDDLAIVSYSHDEFCSTSNEYSSLSSSKQASFNAIYRQINRLGFGSSNANASVSESYSAFCSKTHDFSTVDRRAYQNVSTIYSDSLATVNLCLESARNNVTVKYIPSAKPEDNINITFQLIGSGSQRIDGISANNATCKHGNNVLNGQFDVPIEITSNAKSIECIRRSQPIKMFGLDGTLYPRTQISIYTNYANSALDIIREEAVTGPLQARLDNFEKEMRGLVSNVTAQTNNNSQIINNIRMQSRLITAGPSGTTESVACNSDEIVTACYAYISPSGDSVCGTAVSQDGRVCSTSGCGIPEGQVGYMVVANCSRILKD